jgi:hypothetical protein
MGFESESQKREIQRWSRLAIQLNGAAESGSYDHITVAVARREIEQGRVFDFLIQELPVSVWQIAQLTDVDRHKLSQHWLRMTEAYDPQQFHVTRNGLALLVAYLLHLIDLAHVTLPK